MLHRSFLIFFMISGLILGGCQVQTTPQDVGHFFTSRTATKDVAPYNGTFRLFGDDVAGVGPLLMTVQLKSGETVGFEVDDKNVPYAIAGQQRLKLAEGRYRWEMTPDAGQVDWDKTNVLVIEVVVAVVVVVLAVGGSILISRSL